MSLPPASKILQAWYSGQDTAAMAKAFDCAEAEIANELAWLLDERRRIEQRDRNVASPVSVRDAASAMLFGAAVVITAMCSDRAAAHDRPTGEVIPFRDRRVWPTHDGRMHRCLRRPSDPASETLCVIVEGGGT